MDEYSSRILERQRFLLRSAFVFPRKDMAAMSELWGWPARSDGHLIASLEMFARRREDLLTLARGEQVSG